MTSDLSNIQETKIALDDIRTQIKNLQRIKTQLTIHLARMNNT